MSTNIDTLDIRIQSSSSGAAANIDELARSLEKLKNSSSLTKVSNNLTKLGAALGALKAGTAGLSGLDSVTRAMESLSGVQKLSGLSSAINTLKKLPDVVSSLDTAALDAFGVAMEKLGSKLGPLAADIDKVSRAFSSLPANVGKTVTAVNRMGQASRSAATAQKDMGDAVDSTSLNIATAVQNIQSMYGSIQWLVQAISGFVASAVEWDGIQFRFGRAFGEDAEEVYQHVQKVSDVLMINQQEFMQYSGMLGSLLSGFGMTQEKVSTIAVGLTELSYDIWAAYNDRYKTLEEAFEAVRSAITGEIEPIRNAGIALTEASMQEYVDSLGMAHIRVQNLTEAQKSEVRYATMVNAAMNQGIVGTYAREMYTAEGAIRTLSQQLKGLAQGLGSLFIPILSAVIPWISAFVSVLYDAVAAVAAFFGIAFFKISWGKSSKGIDNVAKSAGGAGAALGGAADAAKKLQDYTMGFDELNVIDPPDPSSGGGGGGGGGGLGEGLDLDLETLWDESVFAQASKKVDELKQKILDFIEEWKAELIIIAGSLATLAIANLLTQMGEALQWGDKFLGVMSNIKKLASTALVITVSFAFMKAAFEKFMGDEGSMWDYIAGLLIGGAATWVLYSMWGPTGLVIGFGVMAVASLSAMIEEGGLNGETALVGLTGLASAIAAVGIAWKKLGPIFAESKIVNTIQALFGAFKGSSAASSALTFMFPTLSKIGVALSTAAKAVGAFVAGISAPIWGTIAAIIAAVASAALFLARNWDEVKAAAIAFFETNIVPKLEEIKGHWETIKDVLSPVTTALKKAGDWVKKLAKSFGEWWKKAKPLETGLKAIGKAIEFLGGLVVSFVGGAIAGAFNQAVNFIENFIQIFSGLTQIVSGVVRVIVNLFTGDLMGAWEAVKQIGQGIADVFNGLYGMVVGGLTAFWEGVVGWFKSLWDELVGHSIVPDTINAIVEWFLSLPEKILGPIEEFCKAVQKRFEDMWASVQDWWGANVAPKFTTEYWEGVFDTIREAIESKLDAVKKKVSEKWAEIKQWFNINIAPKFTLSYWQNKFESIRSAVHTKLTETKDAIVKKWGEIKSWYDTNVAPKLELSYWTDKIADFVDVGKEVVENIKKGLSEAWDKLAGWWSKLELPKFKVKIPKFSLSGLFDAVTGSTPNVIVNWISGWFAQGGFPDMGQLFIAREAGPEMVGSIGGRTAVANNDQIVAAVSQGVYQAVVSAMANNGSGNTQAVNVYLDGQQIYTSMKKAERDRGVSLMGNQLGYAY